MSRRGDLSSALVLVGLILIAGAATATSGIGLARAVVDPDVLQTPQVERALLSLGLSLRGSILVALVLPLVITTASAVLIFVKRTRDRIALLFATAMVCLQSFTSVGNISLLEQGGIARWTTLFVLWLAMPGVLAVLYLFPDGRFRPRWTRVSLALFCGSMLALRGTPEAMMELIRPGAELNSLDRLGVLVVGAAIVSGMYAQYHRYGHQSSGVERQQAKWVTFPLGLSFTYMLLTLVLPRTLVDLSDAWVGWVMVGAIPLGILFPVCITIAILKYRLYDIDVVISKTVVFAGLAAFITAIYVGIVVGVGSLLGAGNEPNLALSIVATGVVAVAFQPVRERLTRLANRLVFGHRATPYEVLSTFAGTVRDTASPGSMLDRMAKLVADGTGADRVFVWLRVDEQVRAASVWPEVFLLDPIPDRELGDPASAVFDDFDHVEEVAYDGDLLGAITLTEPRGEALNHTERELLADLAGQAALVLRNLRLTEELRGRIEELHSSRRRLVRAQDDERRRLERDLHEGAQRHLAQLTRAVREAQATAGREGAGKAAGMLVQVAEDGEAAMRTVGELAHGIYPPVLASEGLPGALSAQAARAAVPVKLDASDIGRYHPDVEAAVYFCVLEAVNNTAKYADASQLTIHLAQSNGHLTFEVSDDGVGFDPATTAKGHGTTNMADRLDALGGAIQIESRPGGGTVVGGRLPAERREVEMGANQ